MQGEPWGNRARLGNGPMASLRCPVQMLRGVVLVMVQVPMRDLLVKHLCRVHVELCIAVKLYPVHCSLNFSVFSTNMCLVLLEGELP